MARNNYALVLLLSIFGSIGTAPAQSVSPLTSHPKLSHTLEATALHDLKIFSLADQKAHSEEILKDIPEKTIGECAKDAQMNPQRMAFLPYLSAKHLDLYRLDTSTQQKFNQDINNSISMAFAKGNPRRVINKVRHNAKVNDKDMQKFYDTLLEQAFLGQATWRENTLIINFATLNQDKDHYDLLIQEVESPHVFLLNSSDQEFLTYHEEWFLPVQLLAAIYTPQDPATITRHYITSVPEITNPN